jgi:hypothetical protein
LNDWTEGDVYLVPSNGGEAVAWIHCGVAKPADCKKAKKDDSLTEDDKPSGHAILQIAKIPLNKVLSEESKNSEPTGAHDWVSAILNLCRKGLFDKSNDDDTNTAAYYMFSEEDSLTLREAFEEAEKKMNTPETPAQAAPGPGGPSVPHPAVCDSIPTSASRES